MTDFKDDARFEREIATIARLDHPCIVPVLGAGVEEGTPYFAMKLIEGREFAALLDVRSDEWDIIVITGIVIVVLALACGTACRSKPASEGGADAVSVINTCLGLAVDWRRRRPLLGNGMGGLTICPLSDAAVMPMQSFLQRFRPEFEARIHETAAPGSPSRWARSAASRVSSTASALSR